MTRSTGILESLAALFLILLALKLTGVMGWSWWWVTAPVWIPVMLWLGLAALCLWARVRVGPRR